MLLEVVLDIDDEEKYIPTVSILKLKILKQPVVGKTCSPGELLV